MALEALLIPVTISSSVGGAPVSYLLVDPSDKSSVVEGGAPVSYLLLEPSPRSSESQAPRAAPSIASALLIAAAA